MPKLTLTGAMLPLLLLAACGSPTLPTPPPPTVPVAQSAPASTTSPAVAPQPAAAVGSGVEITFSTFASFTARNTGGEVRNLEAYITSFDDQGTALQTKTASLAPGGTWEATFSSTCVQTDVKDVGGKILGFAYFDKEGKQFGPGTNPEKIAECRFTPTPPPSPSPSPTCSPSPTPPPFCEKCYCFYTLSSEKPSVECSREGGEWGGGECKLKKPGVKRTDFLLLQQKSAAECLR